MECCEKRAPASYLDKDQSKRERGYVYDWTFLNVTSQGVYLSLTSAELPRLDARARAGDDRDS